MFPEGSTVVISLSRRVDRAASSAVFILGNALQPEFQFFDGGPIDCPLTENEERSVSWKLLEQVLLQEKQKRGFSRVIGILDSPIQDNWFSRTAYGKNVAWITTHNWGFYSDLPVQSYIAYQLVTNLLLMQLVKTPRDEEWLMKEVVHLNETRACISDMCAFKPDIAKGIRSGNICPDCQQVIKKHLGEKSLEAAKLLLHSVRSIAVPVEQKTSICDFPELEKLGNASILSSPDIKPKQRNLSEPTVMESMPRMRCFTLPNFIEEESSFSSDIERLYPFPIAYCFRSVRSQIQAIDKWMALYDLYRLTIRYITFVLASDSVAQNSLLPRSTEELLKNSTHPGDGVWGKACFDILKSHKNSPNVSRSFVREFIESFELSDAKELVSGSIAIVGDRNNAQGHGFHADPFVFQGLFEEHLPAVKKLLSFIGPLSKHILISPAHTVSNIHGKCVFISKVLMGANPLFITANMTDAVPPETVCQLLGPGGVKSLSLHPWLQLDRCKECAREMVFLFDRTVGDGRISLREYPSNHLKTVLR